MMKPFGRLLVCLVVGGGLSAFSGCTVLHFSDSGNTVAHEDGQFVAEYPHLKELLRENHFRRALAWVLRWEKVRNLSGRDRGLLLKDQRTIRMVGAVYYMGVSRERESVGRYRGALSALETARTFEPDDPVLRRKIQRAKAMIIVRGESGQDWAVMVRKLLALKSRSPRDRSVDPMIGWAYAKLARSEYTAGQFGLALRHSRDAISYDPSANEALRVHDQVAEMVNRHVVRAEMYYREHKYDAVKEELSQALGIDPADKRARKDWRILAETPPGTTSVPASPAMNGQ